MSLAEPLLGLALVAGAIVIGWTYTLTDRGRTLGRDIRRTRRLNFMLFRRAFIARHWPIYLAIVAYTVLFGLFASRLGF